MLTLLPRLLIAAVPVIALLVAAAFVLPAEFPFFLRQLLLAAIGMGGIALAEVAMFRTPLVDLGRRLGFTPTSRRTVIISLIASLPMWLFLPLASLAAGTPVHVASNGLALVLGIVLVNGLAEEVIHRAFFFGRLREHTSLAKAASLGAALFGAQHLYLIATIGVAGVASVVLALLLAYPLSRAYEMGGRSIVGPAILHTSSNAAFLVFGDASNSGLLMLHMLVVLVSIYTVFLFRQPPVPATAHPAAAPASL
ncbi:MAG TPA: CPBP family intramembrane glutamic endopeptidase [Devosia sp.]|jgi:membrane protease YdiL (CAAX protease family)|uniref:CPBP family intramembrane glutamic endopeptidase n=1 Tax=Devosia sp. TaxID=1871048 RepID=UPI002DDD36A4|nr:CPBP family intramembrane glutamic endopeptidase [Devosia sp.]HEV2513813.1 CPBP family intramembrane glutamic endopeptidase [Devosia sp.]